MKKEKKMRKKIVGFIIAGILVLVFGLVSTPARAEVSLGLVGGYYSPNFGEINDYLADYYGTDLKFEAREMYELAVGFDVTPHFRLRLEYQDFQSKTRGTETHFDSYSWYKWTLTTTPLILSAIYRAIPFYMGAGVGSFPTRVEVSGTQIGSDRDSPIGFVVLAGLEFMGEEETFLNLEARYVSAEADLDEFGTKVDLSGFQVCVTTGLKFK